MKSKRKSKLISIHLALFAGVMWASASQAALQEYAVKAAYIFNFAKFIDWPPDIFPSATAPVIVGVLGADPFGSFLDDTFRGQAIQGRPVMTKRLKNASCPECHLLFVSSSEAGRLREILDANREKHVVTISDIPQFDARGGIIRLYMQENKVRFVINSRAAEAAGVKFSSQLLKLSHAPGGI